MGTRPRATKKMRYVRVALGVFGAVDDPFSDVTGDTGVGGGEDASVSYSAFCCPWCHFITRNIR